MKAYSRTGQALKPGETFTILTDERPQTHGQAVEILDRKDKVVNVAQVANAKRNPPHWKQKYSVQVIVIV